MFFYFNPHLIESLKETFSTSQAIKSLALKWGASLTGISCFLLFLFYQINKVTYYQVDLEPCLTFSLNPHFITSYLDEFFKKEYPNQNTSFALKFNKGQIEILIDLSNISILSHEKELKSWEKKLLPQLCARFGVPKNTRVSVICQKI